MTEFGNKFLYILQPVKSKTDDKNKVSDGGKCNPIREITEQKSLCNMFESLQDSSESEDMMRLWECEAERECVLSGWKVTEWVDEWAEPVGVQICPCLFMSH